MIKLSQLPTTPPKGATKEDYKHATNKLSKAIAEKQHLLYAEGKQALLVIFQGMDASGKDGATRKIFRYSNPSGLTAHAFKKPTDVEFAHDFLWRVHKLVPAQGQVVIFNRSHYEDIVIQRVHGWIDEPRVDMRIDAINAFEQLLVHDNRTRILKFYMHISKDRQAEKLQERIDDPTKYWKHNPNDWNEREHWDTYMSCYEECINRCNTIPWIVAPVDSRWYRDYFIATKILETLNEMEFTLKTAKTD